MKWSKWLENWDMTSLKISAPFLEMEWKPQDEDKAAAGRDQGGSSGRMRRAFAPADDIVFRSVGLDD